MIPKLFVYGLAGILAIALVGGLGYLLVTADEDVNLRAASGGRGRESLDADKRGGYGRQGNAGGGRDSEYGWEGEGLALEADDWQVVTGDVLVAGNELTVSTDAGEVEVGLGQAAYREAAEFVVAVGDEVSVSGYYDGGEFKAAVVDNLTSGESIVLRDESGRPMWAGQGRGRNRS